MKIVRFKLNGKNCIFFNQVKDKAVRLICRQSFNMLKLYNLKRHHEQKHDVIAKLNDSARNTKLQLLKLNLQAQQNVFQKAASEDKAIVNASLCISQIIAKKMKPFSDGEFVKDCLLAAVEELAPTKVKDFRKSFPSNCNRKN